MRATIIGFTGEALTEKLKKKIETLVQTAIKEYEVTDFYFGNSEDGEEDAELGEKPYLKKIVTNYREVLDFVAQTIQAAKKQENISSTIIVARPIDKNYNKELYDEVIQGYYVYYEDIDSENSLEAYDLRDALIVENIDLIFWYSNKILVKTSSMFRRAENYNKKIVFA